MPGMPCPFCGCTKVEPVPQAENSLVDVDCFRCASCTNRWFSSPSCRLTFTIVTVDGCGYS